MKALLPFYKRQEPITQWRSVIYQKNGIHQEHFLLSGVTHIVVSTNPFMYLSWSCSAVKVRLSGAKFPKICFQVFTVDVSNLRITEFCSETAIWTKILSLWRRGQRVPPNCQKRPIAVHSLQTQKTTAEVPLKKPVLLNLSKYSCLSWNTKFIIVLNAMSWGTRSQSTASSEICFNILFQAIQLPTTMPPNKA
jgi:hypothetical protein